MLDAPGRLSHAQLRCESGELRQVPIDEALTNVAQRLRATIDTHGPDSVAFYVSGQLSTETQYVANKLCKGFIGTNNIDSNSRLCMSSAASGYKLSLGADAPPGSYQDFDHSKCFLVIGSNMADCHPVLFLRLLDRCATSGAKLIVVDPRRTATAEKAHLHLAIRPGTDIALLNGLLQLLVENNKIDREFIRRHVEGWDELAPLLREYTPRKAAEITGLSEDDIRQAASWIGDAEEFMTCWTMGLNQSTHGTWSTNAICNLHLATGKICRRGSGPFSLTGQPNAMGGRETGYLSSGLPGQRTVTADKDREFIEKLWGVKAGRINAQPGWDAVTLFKKLESGEVKAVWIIGTNPVASIPNRQHVIAGLKKAEMVIVQDSFYPNETTPFAHVLLPGALWAEAEGVMVNSERTVTLMPKVVEPAGETLADWDIVSRVAAKMGFADAFSYSSASDIFNEIRQTWNDKSGYDLRGMDYAKLRNSPMQWPCPPGEKRGRTIRYLPASRKGEMTGPAFPFDSGKARFLARPHLSPAEMPDAEFPLILTTGRLPHQWHTMTKTGRVPALNKLNPSPFVEINIEDAAHLEVKSGDHVEVRSRRGIARFPVQVTDRILQGTCFAPIHWNSGLFAVNAATNDAVDSISLQPELKFCAVHLRKVPKEALALDFAGPLASREEKLKEKLHLTDPKPPAFNAGEREYLNGFLSGLSLSRLDSGDVIPSIPASAPFTAEKRQWLEGLLAGLYSRRTLPREELAQATDQKSLLIMVGSQTGKAEFVAIMVASAAKRHGYEPIVVNMMDFKTVELQTASRVIVVTSTYGDGDPPDNAREFWNYLNSDSAPKLERLEYAVLALGDRSFAHFCNFGKNMDNRLEILGAKRILIRGECDADYEQTANQWIRELLGVIGSGNEIPAQAPAPAPALAVAEPRKPKGPRPDHSRKNPYPARLAINRLLTSYSAKKETRHFEISLGDSEIEYEAGALIGIWPENCRELVRELLDLLRCSGDELVPGPNHTEIPLRFALAIYYDITKISREFIQAMAHRAMNPELSGLLLPAHAQDWKTYQYRMQIADVLVEHPDVSLSAREFCGLLKKLQPRMYTIASSPKAHPGRIHLTVDVVRFEHKSRRRKGVCSTFLTDRSDERTTVPIFVQSSTGFGLPADDDTPLLMVSQGTGIAAFRSFLAERQARGSKASHWLFFGEESSSTNFLYRDELETFVREGTLTRLDTAFRRDHSGQLNVADSLRINAAEVWKWLERGAHFYVCGDTHEMAPAIDTALHAILAEQGAMSADEAQEYVKALKKQKRYQRNVY